MGKTEFASSRYTLTRWMGKYRSREIVLLMTKDVIRVLTLTWFCPEVSYNEYETLFLSYTYGMIAPE